MASSKILSFSQDLLLLETLWGLLFCVLGFFSLAPASYWVAVAPGQSNLLKKGFPFQDNAGLPTHRTASSMVSEIWPTGDYFKKIITTPDLDGCSGRKKKNP